MDTIKLGTFPISNFAPWKITSNEMSPNILLTNKLLLILLVVNNFYSLINDPFLPFINALDFLNNYPSLFKNSLRIFFLIFGIFLLFNIKTKLSSIFLGLVIFLTLLASKVVFRNHIFIVGCIFFLSGLTSNKDLPWLLIIQVSLLYLSTSLNKIFEPDWWTGQFMHNWLQTALENPIYNYFSNLLPELLFAKVLSWSVIIVEAVIGILFLFHKWRALSIWLVLIFHLALFTMVHEKFGHFLQDLFIILIAFLAWPRNKVTVRYQIKKSTSFIRLIRLLDWSNIFNWTKNIPSKSNWLEVEYNHNMKVNKAGYKSLLIYSPSFYVLLFFIDLLESHLLGLTNVSFLKISIHLVYCIFLWSLIVVFIPIKIKKGKLKFLQKPYQLV